MPGANCAIFGCGTCRNQKEFSLFKLPTPKDEEYKQWREEMIRVITKDRVPDAAFKERLLKDKVFICEKHFEDSQIYFCKFMV